MCLFFFFILYFYIYFFFFFQAEDGIRDGRVTGVQTCALPISTAPITARLTNSSESARCTASSVAMNGGRTTDSPELRLTTRGVPRAAFTEPDAGRYDVACSLCSRLAAWSAVIPARLSG